MRDAILKELLGGFAKCQPGESLLSCGQLPLLSGAYQLPFFGLCFSPVAGFQALPKPFTVHEEMRVPRLTAFYEGHDANPSFLPISFVCAKSGRAQSTIVFSIDAAPTGRTAPSRSVAEDGEL
jgi:hypothetical protein